MRLRSTAEGIHIMSQSNMDATFKISLRPMNDRPDLLPLPQEKSRMNSLGIQMPYPVLAAEDEAYKNVSSLLLRDSSVLPRARAAQESRASASNQRKVAKKGREETAADRQGEESTSGRCGSNFTAGKDLFGYRDRRKGIEKRLYEALFSSVCTHLVVHLAFLITTGTFIGRFLHMHTFVLIIRGLQKFKCITLSFHGPTATNAFIYR